jgi:HD-GYP domain-containing protein (c-di-GMP phosphodiesterase class II)
MAAPTALAASPGDTSWCGQLLISLHHFAEALGEAVDVKDHYTRSHSVVVAEVAHHLATALGLNPARCAEVHVAGHLHDLGKIGLPDRVLQATGPLSQEDWQEIKRHPVLGYEILRHVPLLAPPGGIAEMVLYHHERFDGSGYPFGLRGEEIPLGARIIAVADAFSAMVDDRVYRKGLAVELVFAELAHCAGSQFDPRVAAAMCDQQAAVCARWQTALAGVSPSAATA